MPVKCVVALPLGPKFAISMSTFFVFLQKLVPDFLRRSNNRHSTEPYTALNDGKVPT